MPHYGQEDSLERDGQEHDVHGHERSDPPVMNRETETLCALLRRLQIQNWGLVGPQGLEPWTDGLKVRIT